MPENLTAVQIQIFLLVFVRITAMISLLPIFGSQNIPPQLVAGFSFLLAIILYPFASVNSPQTLTFTLMGFTLMVIKEVLVGITIGFAASFLFVAVLFAGRLIDSQMGFALVELLDPFTNMETTVTGQFQVLIFSIVFLLINGHYFLLLAVAKSFEVIPLISIGLPSGKLTAVFVGMVGDIFVLSMRLAAPVFTVIVLSELAMGIVARTVPQINIFFVGLPLKIGLGLTTLAIVLPAMISIFRDIVNILMRDIWKLLYLMA